MFTFLTFNRVKLNNTELRFTTQAGLGWVELAVPKLANSCISHIKEFQDFLFEIWMLKYVWYGMIDCFYLSAKLFLLAQVNFESFWSHMHICCIPTVEIFFLTCPLFLVSPHLCVSIMNGCFINEIFSQPNGREWVNKEQKGKTEKLEYSF